MFPDLTRTPRGVMHASGTGVPVHGDNTFDVGIDLERFDDQLGAAFVDEWLTIRVWARGTSVTNASYVGRTGNFITVNFQQSGSDQCFVEAELTHSLVR